MNHDAIRRVYKNAKTIDDGAGVFDADGNQITIDQALVDAGAAELQVEAQWKELRRERNKRLAETDWEIVKHKELGTNIPAALKSYRAALRDLPDNTSDPANPTWPVKPS
jgi:hypothetical protein